MKERNVTGPVSLGRLCLLPDVATSLSQLNVQSVRLNTGHRKFGRFCNTLAYTMCLYNLMCIPYTWVCSAYKPSEYIYTCRHHFEHSLPKVMSRLSLKDYSPSLHHKRGILLNILTCAVSRWHFFVYRMTKRNMMNCACESIWREGAGNIFPPFVIYFSPSPYLYNAH